MGKTLPVTEKLMLHFCLRPILTKKGVCQLIINIRNIMGDPIKNPEIKFTQVLSFISEIFEKNILATAVSARIPSRIKYLEC